ncbi:MAG TPA: universal stress protein [Streptosporangiaceae bacterium]
MPGIIVGMDGSAHSQRALRRAIKEAAVHDEPLTVIAIHQAVVGYAGGALTYPQDASETERARAAAQAETDKALAEADAPRPPSVTVTAVHGIPAEVLVNASKDADMIVLGGHGTGGLGHVLMGSVVGKVTHQAACPVLIVTAEHHNHG